MLRRLAILDDNQRCLEARLRDLRDRLPGLLAGKACAAVVIGSVAAGRARDESDIDVVVVLSQGLPSRSDYRWWDTAVAPGLGAPAGAPFPVQPLFIGRSALATTEPHLRQALDAGIPLWDPESLLP